MNGFQLRVIKKAIENEHKLSSWEIDFIESLQDKGEKYELSDRQNETLNRISDKVY